MKSSHLGPVTLFHCFHFSQPLLSPRAPLPDVGGLLQELLLRGLRRRRPHLPQLRPRPRHPGELLPAGKDAEDERVRGEDPQVRRIRRE